MSSISISRIIDKHIVFFGTFIFLCTVLLISYAVKGWQEENTSYVVETGNSKGTWIDGSKIPAYDIDTMKPKPINHNYKLTGSDTTFRFLIYALQQPRNVTPNQLDALIQWIQSAKQDTVTSKPK